MGGLAVAKDEDYGITIPVPEGWRLYLPSSSPVRFAVSGDSSVVLATAPLAVGIVKKGLKHTVKWLAGNVIDDEIGRAEIIYNVERGEELRRDFHLKLFGRDGVYDAIGQILLVRLRAGNASYSEYFIRCALADEGRAEEEHLKLLELIRKEPSGVGYQVLPVRVERKIYTAPGVGELLWSVDVPATATLVPRFDGVFGTTGRLTFDISVRSVSAEDIGEPFLKSVMAEFLHGVGEGEYRIVSKSVGELSAQLKAEVGDDRAATLNSWWFKAFGNPRYVIVTTVVYLYPKTAEFGATQVGLKLISTWTMGSGFFRIMNEMISEGTGLVPQPPRPSRDQAWIPPPTQVPVRVCMGERRGYRKGGQRGGRVAGAKWPSSTRSTPSGGC